MMPDDDCPTGEKCDFIDNPDWRLPDRCVVCAKVCNLTAILRVRAIRERRFNPTNQPETGDPDGQQRNAPPRTGSMFG